jgi:hypothetical protein
MNSATVARKKVIFLIYHNAVPAPYIQSYETLNKGRLICYLIAMFRTHCRYPVCFGHRFPA